MPDTCRIRVLPPLLVNKIAAGEVVERPASVVKELIDNAIDAGAGRIVVTTEEGGRALIRVTDDGGGMSAEELRLAVTPHATSKIVSEEDLYAISTMGFRGEALASISAVARMRIVSRRPDDVAGAEVRVAGEQLESSGAAGCPSGTTVEVRDLFFNVPARRKFLRAASTETGYINDHVARSALAWPGIAFEQINNGRKTRNLPATNDRQSRIGRLFGPELGDALMEVRREERGLTIEAYLVPPSGSRATAQWQYTFVNGRYIRDKFVQHAIREAYRGLIEPNRHAVVFIFLTIPPEDVDVNVHPTKSEVRWADSHLVHSQVLSAMRETLQEADLVTGLNTRRAAGPRPSEEEQEKMRAELAAMLKTATPLTGGGESRSAGPDPFGGGSSGTSSVPGGFGRGLSRGHSYDDPTASWRALYGPPAHERAEESPEQPLPGDRQLSEPSPESSPVEALHAPLRNRAIQMHNLYLVAETDEGIIIVDQHALHERVMYEQLRERFSRGVLEAQRLLLPETVRVTADQMAALEDSSDLLARLGVEISPIGSDAVAVHTFPALLKNVPIADFLRDLVERLVELTDTSTEVIIHKVLDMMACKAAVKAGDELTQLEIDALIAKRHLVEKATSCPHGRPTMLRLTKEDLNRQFKRT